jgi:CDP-glucose 4,6-dehydratase
MTVINGDFWRGKRVFVTGHTGFMGGWLTVVLGELGARVIGYALEPPTTPCFFDAVGLSALLDEDTRADVRDLAKLSAVIRAHEPEIIFHLAAQPLVREALRQPVETFDVNVMGTVKLLEAARKVDSVRTVIVVTTDKVYENLELDWEFRENDRLGGREPYGVSKAAAEFVVDAYRQSYLAPGQVGVATVRAGNIIGGGDWAAERLVPDIVRAFSAGATLAVRNPAATRPWQHVLEPIRGCLMLAEALFDDPARFAGGWNFGAARDDQRPVSWIVEYCARQWGEGARWKVDSGVHSYEAQRLGLTSSKAELQLGWRPVWRLETALDHTLHWYRAMIDGRDMLKHTQAQIHEAMPVAPEGSLLRSAQ